MNENTSDNPNSISDDERMGGHSERDYLGVPLDEEGVPEKYFIQNPNDPEKLVEIDSKTATKLVLQGRGNDIIKSLQLIEED